MTSKGLVLQTHITLLVGIVFLVYGCNDPENQAHDSHVDGSICAVLAHPDDETIISGTLAKLADLQFEIFIVYMTSGDDGPDETGRGLHGKTLAEAREAEACNALQSIADNIHPIFLRYPDGHVHEYLDSIKKDLQSILDQSRPNIVISFGPDGITGNRDHISTGLATDYVFGRIDYSSLLLHMAITKPLPPFYASGIAVPKEDVDLYVKVSKFHKKRIQVVEAHHTQFNSRVKSSYKILVHFMRKEKFIIAASRNGDEWLEKCVK